VGVFLGVVGSIVGVLIGVLRRARAWATEYLLAGTVLKPRREHSVRVLLLMLALQLLQVSL
jgi:hypothetical protein